MSKYLAFGVCVEKFEFLTSKTFCGQNKPSGQAKLACRRINSFSKEQKFLEAELDGEFHATLHFFNFAHQPKVCKHNILPTNKTSVCTIFTDEPFCFLICHF